MRPLLFLIPFTLGVMPLEAQYTPAQRSAIESEQRRQEILQEQRYYEESRTAMARAQESRDRVFASERDLELRNPAMRRHRDRSLYLPAPERVTDRAYRLGQILFAVTARGVISRHLDPAGPVPRSVPQRTPGRLTFVSPDGGPNGTVAAEVSIADLKGNKVTTVTEQPQADSEGVYRIDLPALRLGEYTMTVTTTALDRASGQQHVSVQRLVARE
jgi:hypothetical protein